LIENKRRRAAGLDSADGDILIAFGANLPGPRGSPTDTCQAALEELTRRGVRIRRRSPFYESAPVPPSGQPWYVNGVAAVATDLAPEALLALLHDVERQFGRERRVANEARVIDLDLLAYGGLVRDAPPILPHPRLALRAFVLLPLRDVAPGWVHPASGLGVEALIARLPPGQSIRRR
jgi:2-amino-4-hydroxy-6-hydroxymethyldihydropteridine diphosphokinase